MADGDDFPSFVLLQTGVYRILYWEMSHVMVFI